MHLLFFILLSSCTLHLIVVSASTVTHLPGFNGELPFRLETGYVSVDEATKAELFYYLIESERNPREDPLILWLTGGPGCSSLYGLVREIAVSTSPSRWPAVTSPQKSKQPAGLGLANSSFVISQIGPIRFNDVPYDGTLPTLVSNPYAWTKISSIIFLDWPGKCGFSLRYVKDFIADDLISSKEIYNFLKQWFLDHPHFKSNHFYVAGNSYGGKMVPIVAHNIAEGIDAGQHPLINLKGYICGNPVTSALVDGNSRVSFAHGKGILPDELAEAIQRTCPGENYKKPETAPCVEQIKIYKGFLNELMLDDFLTPKCLGESAIDPLSYEYETGRPIPKRNSTKLHAPPPVPDIKCTTYPGYLTYLWANDNVTRKALHVKEGTVKEWQVCNDDLIYDQLNIHSSIPYHSDVINRGYRALIFSGDIDLVIPFTGTMEWIESLNVSVVEPWRSWHVNGQVGGYTVRYSKNVTFATVKGGGHEPSKARNKETAAIFYRWISHQPL